MKVALVHDYLNQIGGAERVLDVLMQMYPDAPIYTLMHDSGKTLGKYEGRVKGTSFLDFQFARDHHRLFIPLMPLAARSINLGSRYDLIISTSAGFGKGIRYNKKTTKHICYVHTPLRYAWETKTYFSSKALRFFGAPAFWYVRRFDYKAGQKPDVLIANSEYIADKIKKYYGRDAQVIYPPVDTSKFYFDPSASTITYNLSPITSPISSHYYLALGRLLHYKRFDVVIDAFTQLKLPLKIVGAGPLFGDLQDRAKKRDTHNISFPGFVKDDAELRALYNGARGFIMANEEDFGLVMAEAQACGVPVIAYGAGGALEIVQEAELGSRNKELGAGRHPEALGRPGTPGLAEGSHSVSTGILFKDQTPESLIEAVKKIEKINFDRKEISEQAQRFSVKSFEQGIRRAIEELV